MSRGAWVAVAFLVLVAVLGLAWHFGGADWLFMAVLGGGGGVGAAAGFSRRTKKAEADLADATVERDRHVAAANKHKAKADELREERKVLEPEADRLGQQADDALARARAMDRRSS